MNKKAKLYLLIAGEVSAGIILFCSSLYTQPTKAPQQLIEDNWKGEQSYPVNESIPFSPLLQLMGFISLGKGVADFWRSFEEEVSPEAVRQLLDTDGLGSGLSGLSGLEEAEPEEKVYYQPRQPNHVTTNVPSHQPASGSPAYRNQQPQPQTVQQVQPGHTPKAPVATQPQAQQVQKQTQKKVEKNSVILNHLLDRFKYNIMSTAFVGAPGAGKSTGQKAWMASIYERCPEANFSIVTRKNDSFLGLANIPGCVVQVRNDNLYPLFPQVKKVDQILQDRLDLPEGERDNLPDEWLVLDDWFATAIALSKSKDKKIKSLWEKAQTRLANIVTLGREVRVAVCVSTHTLNLEHLGLVADSTLRSYLNLCFFCRETTNAVGQVEGGFELIQSVFQSQYYLSVPAKKKLYPKFQALKEHSRQKGLPLLLHTMGEPEVGLMPDLSWTKTYQIPVDPVQVADHFENLYKQDSDFDVNLPDLIQIETEEDYEENYGLDSNGSNSGSFLDYDEEEDEQTSTFLQDSAEEEE